MLNIESIESLFYDVVNSDEWKELQEKFNRDIDELNQETENLVEEIEKWQM